MIDFLLKEEICKVKVMALAMLNMTIEDELYSRDKIIRDLEKIIAFLDQMEDPVTSWN